MADPILIPSYNEGYPSPYELDVTTVKVQTAPFPTVCPIKSFTLNEGYLDIHDVDAITPKIQTAPFPKAIPVIRPGYNDGYIDIANIDAYNVKTQAIPFPLAVPNFQYAEYLEGYPANRLYDTTFFGAFSNVSTLIKAKIPRSVKYIADYAFWNTSLIGVRIASDCQYFEHSFPTDCVIEFYPD